MCTCRLNTDPDHVEKNHLVGKKDDREEFGVIKSCCRVSMCACARARPARGCSTIASAAPSPALTASFTPAAVEGTYTGRLPAVPGRVFTLLSVEEGHPRLQTQIAGQEAIIERVFLETEVRWDARKPEFAQNQCHVIIVIAAGSRDGFQSAVDGLVRPLLRHRRALIRARIQALV